MTPEQVEDVRADIWAEPWKDPQLFPDLLHRIVTELGEIATGDNITLGFVRRLGGEHVGDLMQGWAEDMLAILAGRATSGIPFGEPAYGDLGPTNPKDI